jgi:threonine dehydratase
LSETKPALLLPKAITDLQRLHLYAGSRKDTKALQVPVFAPYSVGAIHSGIDWDANKIMLQTERPVTLLTPEDVAAIHKSAKEGQSWHAYQMHKKLSDRIRALEAELAALKQGGV